MKTLAAIVLAAAIYVSAFVYVIPYFTTIQQQDRVPSSESFPSGTDPCTEVINGHAHRYGVGYSCPCSQPCGYCECRDGVCTRLYDIAEQDIQEDITVDDTGVISLTISDEECVPGRYNVQVALQCTGAGYHGVAHTQTIIEPHESLRLTLERPWIDRIETQLECSVVISKDIRDSWTGVLNGIPRVSGCYERSIHPHTGAVIKDQLPDGTSCIATVYSRADSGEFIIDEPVGLCGAGICGPNIPFWWEGVNE